jgi:hypothetical protein
MPCGLAEIGIVPRGKKDWTVTLAEGSRRRKTAIKTIFERMPGTRAKPIVALFGSLSKKMKEQLS